MLLLTSDTLTIEGVTVFHDHADPNQFWYLPGPVGLAHRSDNQKAAFTFIKYKPAVVAAGVKGGGFLMFGVTLLPDPHLEEKILAQLSSLVSGNPQLALVPFDEGTVQCLALNLQGAGGTTATSPVPGTFNAVERILGASIPSLQGDEGAIFSLTLDQEGATILEQSLKDGTTPIGALYTLKFTGLRPALHVKITADLKRVYDEFSVSLSGQYYFVKAGIDLGFEHLVQTGAIKIEVIDFVGQADKEDKEKWALDFFKDHLLSSWFQPTLTPGQIAGGSPSGQGGTATPPTKPPTSSPPASPPAKPAPTPPPAGGTTTPPPAHPPASTPPAGGATTPPTSTPPPAGGGTTPQKLPDPPVTPPKGGTAGTPSISLKLKYVSQDEQKTVTFDYNRSEATQRTYAPQGLFGLLTADLDMSDKDYFVEIDLDDPFFRVFSVTMDEPIDFSKIGLTSTQLSLNYGDPNDATSFKHGDFLFDAQNKTEKKFQVFMDANYDTSYTYQVQYNFDPQSGWNGQQFSYQLPPQLTEQRTLYINPYEHLAFIEVKVLPNRIDTALIESIDVTLTYEDSNGWSQTTGLSVLPDSAPQFWRLRISDLTVRTYSYQCVHHLKDGTTRIDDPVKTKATSIAIDDPFTNSLDLEFVPLYDPGKIRMVFIDVTYDDPNNHYHREERLKLTGSTQDSVKLRIALLNPSRRTFSYRLTFVSTDNHMSTLPTVTTQDTLISVSN